MMFLTTIVVAGLLRISRWKLGRMRVECTGPRHLKAGRGKRSRVLCRRAYVEERLARSISLAGRVSTLTRNHDRLTAARMEKPSNKHSSLLFSDSMLFFCKWRPSNEYK